MSACLGVLVLVLFLEEADTSQGCRWPFWVKSGLLGGVFCVDCGRLSLMDGLSEALLVESGRLFLGGGTLGESWVDSGQVPLSGNDLEVESFSEAGNRGRIDLDRMASTR